MKIESLKSINYSRGAHTLRVLVQADNTLQVTNALLGKEKLCVYTDNEETQMLVEEITGYQYLSSIEELPNGHYEVHLSDIEPTQLSVAEKKIAEINAHDTSDEVNSFTLGGKQMWLDKSTRVGLANSIGIEQEAGKAATTLWFNAMRYDIPIPLAVQMLNALELYALECYNVTQGHIAAVMALDSIEELIGYDYTSGYPDRLVFNLN